MKSLFRHKKGSDSSSSDHVRRSGGGGGSSSGVSDRVRKVHWWHHLASSGSGSSSSTIANPMLYEPLLVIGGTVGGGALSQEDVDDIDALLDRFTHSTTEELSVLEQLLQYVAPEDQSFNDEGLTILHIAAKKGYQHSLDILIKHSANSWISVPNIMCKRNGHTPLHLAAMYGHESCLHTLLNAKADPTIANFAKKTALHYACSFGYVTCVDAILNHTMGRWKLSSSSVESPSNKTLLINMQDNFGHTSLHLACIDGNCAVVRLLLQAHASVSLVDDENRTALGIARTFSTSPEHLEIVRQLEAASSTLGKKPVVDKSFASTIVNPDMDTLFQGMHVSDSQSNAGSVKMTGGAGDVLFDGLVIRGSPSRSPINVNYHTPKSFLTSPVATPPSPATCVPAGRWVVLQSGMLVAEPTSGTILVHDSRYFLIIMML
jgi:hypothetical protein